MDESEEKLKRRSSLSSVLTFFQILAIVVGAVWALYLFLAFGKNLKKFENLQASLKTQLDTLLIQREKLELTQLKSPLLNLDDEIEITDLGQQGTNAKHLFAVRYRYSISNTGRSRHEVTYVILHAFLAELRVPAHTLAFSILDFEASGCLTWKCVCAKGYYYDPKWKKERTFDSLYGGTKMVYEKGGGGTSELDSGQSSNGSIDLVVLARPNDLVGFETRIGIDDGLTPGNRWRLRESGYLRDKH